MRKFDRLKDYILENGEEEITLSFNEIEKIIGCKLCKSAYTYNEYWYGKDSHSIAKIFDECGYKYNSADLINKNIVLRKSRK